MQLPSSACWHTDDCSLPSCGCPRAQITSVCLKCWFCSRWMKATCTNSTFDSQRLKKQNKKNPTIFTHFSYIFLSFWALGQIHVDVFWFGAAESSPLCWAGWRLLSRVGKKCSHCSRPGHHHYLHCKHFITQWTTEKQGRWIKLHKHLDSFSIYRSVGTTVSKQALWLTQNLCRFNVFKVSGDTQS